MFDINFSVDGKPFGDIHTGLPKGYQGITIPGAEVTCLVAEPGVIIMQDVMSIGTAIRHQLTEWYRSIDLQARSMHKGWQAVMVWSGSLTQTIIGSGRWRLREGEYGTMFTDAWRSHRGLVGSGSSITLELLCTPEWMEAMSLSGRTEAAAGFPHLAGQPFRLVDPVMRLLVEDILFPPFTEPLKTAFVQEQLEQLIMLLMEGAGEEHKPVDLLDLRDLEVVAAAKAFIDDNMHRHIPISAIAHHVGMNDCKLKRIFRDVMRMGMHEYLISQRLNGIREKIINTDIPFKVLFEQAMYATHQSFITGFRRHFGCAPGELRRKK